jgi:hypothetical protein
MSCAIDEECGDAGVCIHGACISGETIEACPDVAIAGGYVIDHETEVLDLAFADFDADGHDDLVVAGDGLVVSPFFGEPWTIDVTRGASIEEVAIADLDGDGDDDIVARAAADGGLLAFAVQGESATPLAATAVLADRVRAGDVNGDGLGDLVLGVDGSVQVHPGVGDGTFATPWVLAHTGTFTVGAIDGDGLADVVRVPGPWMWFGAAGLDVAPPVEVDAGIDLPADDVLVASAAGVNADIVTWAASSNGVYVGEYRWAEATVQAFVVAGAGAGVTAGDLDGDGPPDLLFRDVAVSRRADGIRCTVPYATDAGPVAAGDYDGDGRDQIAYVQPASTTIFVASDFGE